MSEPSPKSSWEPVSAEEFAEWFDSDGRLVKEVTMRQRVFEGTGTQCTHINCTLYGYQYALIKTSVT